MEKKLNTTHEFEFCDGEKTELTLAFYKLYQLKSSQYKAYYEAYNQITTKKRMAEELDLVKILYVAYLCAHLKDAEIMPEETFMEKCGCDREALVEAYEALTQPKKHQASVNRSEEKQGPGSSE